MRIYYKTKESYSITGRVENGDTLRYTRKGKLEKITTYYYINDVFKITHDSSTIDDTQTYIDSLSHFLNKCPDDK